MSDRRPVGVVEGSSKGISVGSGDATAGVAMGTLLGYSEEKSDGVFVTDLDGSSD